MHSREPRTEIGGRRRIEGYEADDGNLRLLQEGGVIGLASGVRGRAEPVLSVVNRPGAAPTPVLSALPLRDSAIVRIYSKTSLHHDSGAHPGMNTALELMFSLLQPRDFDMAAL